MSCESWCTGSRSKNFRTGRKISRKGRVYAKLLKECGCDTKRSRSQSKSSSHHRLRRPSSKGTKKREACLEWLSGNRRTSWKTGRKIKPNGPSYKVLLKECEKAIGRSPVRAPRKKPTRKPKRSTSKHESSLKGRTLPKSKSKSRLRSSGSVKGVRTPEHAKKDTKIDPGRFWLPSGYSIVKVLAEGGQGATALVRHKGKLFVAKQFPPKLSPKSIQREVDFGRIASENGFGPRIHYVNLRRHMFIMDAMEETLCDLWIRQGRKLTKPQLDDLYNLIDRSRKAGIVHNDTKCLNIMMKKGKMYFIDFGFTKYMKNSKFFSNFSPVEYAGYNMERIARDANIVFGKRMEEIDTYLRDHHGHLTKLMKLKARKEAAAAAFLARRKK